jgi:surface antigen
VRGLCVGGAILLAFASAGCSVSFPILGLSSKAEDEVVTTSSVLPARTTAKGALTSLSADLGPEDMRRAEGALSVALDPQGNGAPVSWDNPQSGIKGAFTPVGGPYVSADEICRSFIASVHLQTKLTRLQGKACRPTGGEWVVKETQPWKGSV